MQKEILFFLRGGGAPKGVKTGKNKQLPHTAGSDKQVLAVPYNSCRHSPVYKYPDEYCYADNGMPIAIQEARLAVVARL